MDFHIECMLYLFIMYLKMTVQQPANIHISCATHKNCFSSSLKLEVSPSPLSLEYLIHFVPPCWVFRC